MSVFNERKSLSHVDALEQTLASVREAHAKLAGGDPAGAAGAVGEAEVPLRDWVADARAKAVAKNGSSAARGVVGPFNLTDLGNAERLAARHGDDLRYVPQLGWHVWDGRRWRPDGDGEVHRRAKQVARAVAHDAVELDDADARKRQLAWAMRSEQHPKLQAMVAVAETDASLVVAVDELDRDRYALNVRNGTLDLQASRLHPHRRSLHITKLAPVDYQPGRPAPIWQRFLETIFAGDAELISFVQRALGYSLTGATDEQVLFLLHGRGANGKSTFVETVRALLGDYAQQAPAEMLMQSRSSRGSASPDLARLPGARFVAAVETGEGRRLDEPLVKQLTGGDRIAARRLYRDVFEFAPTHKLWLATNHLPQIGGTDDAIWRRIRLIPFAVTIPEADRDTKLPGKLRAELPGILAWAVEGCSRYLADGLLPPDTVQAATSGYRADMDELGAFLDECCYLGDDGQAGAAELLTLYGYWAQANSATPITSAQLSRSLVERGFQRHRLSGGVVYRGLAIATRDQANLN
jgi:putative DNA primase/helicase